MNLQQTKPEDIKAIPHDEGEPQKGKVLACYTILASLYGEELKRNILDLAKDGQPIKPAVMLFSKEGQADIAIAAGIVKAIKMDFEKHGIGEVLEKEYIYPIQKMYWVDEDKLPKDDPQWVKVG